MEILKQGAEAKLYVGEYQGQRCLVKERFQKKYRHPDLDKQLTRERIRAEVKTIARCQNIDVKTPKIYGSDETDRKIYMEYLDTAVTSKSYINETIVQKPETVQDDLIKRLGTEIGIIVGRLHSNNIVHGDLTTSNVLLTPKGEPDDLFSDYDLVIIDFGLSQYQNSPRAKGVDLYVLERALLSTHSSVPKLFPTILASYTKENSKDAESVIAKFEEVRARGRKRTMVG